MIYVYKDRIINVEWTVLKGTSTVKENFDRALVKLFLIGPHEKFLLKANAKDGIVSAEVPQGLPEGVYSVEIIYIKNWLGVDRPPKMPDRFPIDCRGNDRCIMRSRKDNLFAITEYESEATEIGEGEVVIRVKTSTASYGYDGLSAYEIAVLRGDFEGTEGEWLEWTHERIVSDVKDLLDKLKSRDTRFVVKTKSQRDNLKDLREGDEVYVIDDGIAYILETENGKRTWKPCDYGTVTSKYILSLIAGMPGFVADRAIADEFGKRIVDEYLTRDAVRNYMNEVFNDLFVNNPPTIMDGMITVDMLSDAVKQLIGFGPIVNFPDDEFLTTKGGRITPKDRNYDPNNYSGMGRKILRKNMVNGVNVLTQKMMSCPNTVYVITYDYSLRGQTITVPENCVLQFEGGSLKNGYLKGSLLNSIIDLSRIKVDDLGIFFSYFELRDGQTIVLEKDKVYISSIDINLSASNITFNGNNATIKSTNKTHLSNIIQVCPFFDTYSNLNIVAIKNSNIVSLGDIAKKIKIGDCIQLRDNANRLDLNYHNGTYAIVLDKNGSDITLDIPYNSNIITYMEVYKPLFNIKIFDLTLEFNNSHGQRGIRLIKCRNSEIYNIKADGLGNLAGIYIDDCYYTKVHDCILYKFFDIDRIINMNGYGIAANGRDIEVYNNNVYDCRHCFSGDKRSFVSTVHIHNNTAHNSYNLYTELNGLYEVVYSTMYDLHGNSQGVIENNIGEVTITSASKWYGITVRSSNVTVINNKILNHSTEFTGIGLIIMELAHDNIIITNNTIYNRLLINTSLNNAIIKNNNFYNSFFDIAEISESDIKSISILYNKFYTLTKGIVENTIQCKEDNYNITIQNNIFEDEYNISSSIINVIANVKSLYINDNTFIARNKISGEVIRLNNTQIPNFNLESVISNNNFIIPNLPQNVDIVNYWRGKYLNNYDSRLNSVGRNINLLETESQLPQLGRITLEGSIFMCRDTHKIYVYNYNRYSDLQGRLITVPLQTTYPNVASILSSLIPEKDVGLTLYIIDRKQFVTYNGTTFVRPDGFAYNNNTVRIPVETFEFEVSNCIYKIIYDFDLGGATLTLPSGCTLDFQGGSFSNGTIVGNGTKIIAGLTKIFGTDITLNGTWNCSDIYDSWFTQSEDSFALLQNLCNLTSDNYYGTIYINGNHDVVIPDNALSIKPNSRTTIILEGSITVAPNNFTNYYIFRLIDKNSITIKGGGFLIGDVETHTGTTGEWGHGIFIQGCYNININNLQLKNFWGDGIEVDKSSSNLYTSELYLSNLTIYNNRRQGISLLSVKNVFIDNCVIYGIGSINGTNPKGAIDIEPEGDDIAENIFISNCIEYSNGLGVSAHNTIKNITVDNCTFLSAQGIWHTGDIIFKNCSFGRFFNLEGDIIKFINCDMPITNIISSNLVEIDNCRFRSKASFDTVSDKTSLLCFNYSDAGINKTCKVKVRNSSFDNTKEGTSSIPLVRKALTKNMGDKDVVFENCSFRNTLSYLYGCIQYGDYYNCLFEVPSLALQLYADKAIKIVGSTIVKNDNAADRAILTIESITKNFTEDSIVLFLTGNTFQYSGVSIIDIPATNTNDKKVSFLNNLFSTRYISEESTLYINLKNKFDTFYYSNSRLDYQRYIGNTSNRGTPSINNAGITYFDTDLNKLILWNGTAWTNLDGTSLS